VFRSIRFRIPAIFLAGFVLAGVVASLIAIRLFQDYSRDQSLAELRREAIGLSQLYSLRAGAPLIDSAALERATGDRLYCACELDFEFGNEGNLKKLTRIPPLTLPREVLSDRLVTFEFRPPGEKRTFLAVSTPLKVEESVFGALVVAKPKTELRDRWLTLLRRLAAASLGGILVAGGLAWYLSRRITKPVLALSQAADEVAEGRYDVDVPEVPGGDEIGDLSRRFGEMAARLRETEELERNFLMSVSHELRTPLTAIRGHVEALREGVVEDPDLRAHSLDVIADET
jgi:HAMP domain-containing protein